MENWFLYRLAPARWINLDNVAEIVFSTEAHQETSSSPVTRRLVAHLDTGEDQTGIQVGEPYSKVLQAILQEARAPHREPIEIGVAPDCKGALADELEGAEVSDVLVEPPDKGGRRPIVVIDFQDDEGAGSVFLTVQRYRIERHGQATEAAAGS